MTKENKGICYIKFDRASSAALAIENLDGKVIGDEPKPIKVCPDLILGRTIHQLSFKTLPQVT